MKHWNRLPSWLKNKYFLALAAFALVMLVLDKNDLFTQLERRRELRQLEKSRAWYSTQLELQRKEYEALKNNPASLEKWAREKNLMKRDDEEIFLIPENYEAPKN